MKPIISLIAIAAMATSLAGCDQLVRPQTKKAEKEKVAEQTAEPADSETAPAPQAPERPSVQPATANIDWEAARRDMASRSAESGETGFQVQSGSSAPPVPVLLPTGIVIPQGAESGVKFQPMADGYFATYPGIDYDIIVNGTNEVIGARETGEEPDEPVLHFHPTLSGAEVAFTRYGADYLVQFECNEVRGEIAECIDEEEALEVTRTLVISGTR